MQPIQLPFDNSELDRSIPDRFEFVVQQVPQRTAVVQDGESLTYDQLNRAANQVAHAILAACGGGEGQIGLVFEHGIPVIAAMLGIAKTGKTYLPLDPTYPHDRLASMADHAQISAILCDAPN